MEKDILDGLVSELRRGTVILCVLSQLGESRYGYSLVQILDEKGFAIDANTLYPLLRRLEKQGLLISEWDTAESKPRKYYRRTKLGDEVYSDLSKQWNDMTDRINSLLEG